MSYISAEDVLPKELKQKLFSSMLVEKAYIFHAKRKKFGEARRKQSSITKCETKKYV